MKDNNTNKIIRNSALLFVSRFIDMTAVVLTNVIMARCLGAASFGQYSFISAYVVSITIISYFGLENLAIRDIAKHADKAQHYLGAIIVARWIMSGLAAFLVLAGLPFIGLEHEYLPALALLTASELIGAFATLQTAVFKALEQMQYEVYITMFWRLVSLMLISLGAWRGFGITELCAVIFLANLTRLLLAAWITKTKFFKPDFSEVNLLIRGIFKDALTMGAAVLITNWLFRSAQMAIKFLLGPEPVAYFQVSHAIILQVSTVALSISTALFPVISKKALHDRESLRSMADMYSEVSRLLACFGLVFSVCLILSAKSIILALFGSEYIAAVEVFQVLLVALIPIFIYTFNAIIFAAYNKQLFVIVSRGISLMLVCCLYVLFVPQGGVLGAAYAYVIASACIVLLETSLLSRQVFHAAAPPLGSYFLNLILASGLSATFLLNSSWRLRAVWLVFILLALSMQFKGSYAFVKTRRAIPAKVTIAP